MEARILVRAFFICACERIIYICIMTIEDFANKIKKTGLKKKFIAEELKINDTYFSTFFSKGKHRRAMPKHISVKLQAFLSNY